MIKTAMYLRKSRAEERGDTLEETLRKHKQALADLAKEKHLTVAEVYEEVVSGESLFARPQMLRLLSDIQSGEYDAVLCMDIDRLGRGGMKDQGMILETFKDSGTKIITPDKTYDLSDESDEELTEFKTFMSRRELKIINKRLRRGLNQVIFDGAYIPNAPYGYTKIVKDKKPTLEINEDETYFVRMIFKMYASGTGCTNICKKINSLGAKPRRSQAFTRVSINHILRNQVYIGKVVWNRYQHIKKGKFGNDRAKCIPKSKENWIISDGMHPAIISQDLFDRVQEILRSRYIPSHNDGTICNPLAGLVTCSGCGQKMQRMAASKSVPYLLCNTKGCVAGAKLEYVEEALILQLWDMMGSIELEIAQRKSEDMSGLSTVLSDTKKQLELCAQQKNKLHDFLEQEVYDIATYQERLKTLSEKIVVLKAQETAQIDEIRAKSKECKKELVQKIKSVLDVYTVSDTQSKNMLLKSIVSRIYYDKLKKTKPTDFKLDIILKN